MTRTPGRRVSISAALLLATLSSVPARADAAPPTFRPELVWRFDRPGGVDPSAGLAVGSDGTLYGSTRNIRDATGTIVEDSGTIFRLRPGSELETLYSFDEPDEERDDRGRIPRQVTVGPDGRLYSSVDWGAISGGACHGPCARDPGHYFVLAPVAEGATEWKPTPVSGPIAGEVAGHRPITITSDGSLLVTGNSGDFSPKAPAAVNGAVYRLAEGEGGWTTSAVSYFVDPDGRDDRHAVIGAQPQGALALGCHCGDTIYGTATFGGAVGLGTIFRLKLSGKGYRQKLVKTFKWTDADPAPDNDGMYPDTGLVITPGGRLYGTTSSGGINDRTDRWGPGVLYTLKPSTTGAANFRILHRFGDRAGDGAAPRGGLLVRRNGHVWGTTSEGGACGNGTLFRLIPVAGGASYRYQIAASFGCGDDDFGSHPFGAIVESAGWIYGVTSADGGTIWRVKVGPNP
ncbi:choice-of-anchor tandem repeat GloVer-containing protein [Oharaeibacter diazotrophicus]|uniref:Putative repeat protein (TIGR03803 family) n=1 Tax=Oharaeibacter diazotrophicus TaxID=1920512 RepID=A0A4R6R6R2_9HYPH|nr:choice-of-anchor tandem repeat GloVer-containing protein [Oharaeibacter diazotrophicus]TDP81494.1 putative repeat protein (TIGR03803 family) [Oharaeibacter diazotrophicus]BBE73732.1 hypothetical protein OHA_1_03348 [Pleomorphomonas sp. SM30]GLS75522.1 hypothetical protein GCM10007904_08570 [Oharaeibacter diazotrophicus]